MPFNQLPTKLQAYIRNNYREETGALDLSGYSFAQLTHEEFKALVQYLREHPRLKELHLKNCDLAKVRNNLKLYELLKDLKELNTIDLSDNESQRTRKRVA